MTRRHLTTPALLTAILLVGSGTVSASPGKDAPDDAQDREVSLAYSEISTDDAIHRLDLSMRVEFPQGPRTTFDVGGAVASGGQSEDGGCASLCGSSGIDVHARAMVAPRVAMVSRVWGRSAMDDLDSITYGLVTQSVRYSVRPGLWVETGVGMARLTIDRDEELDVAMGEVSPAIAAAAGVDMVSVAGVDVALELRGGGGLYAQTMPLYTADLLLGARW